MTPMYHTPSKIRAVIIGFACTILMLIIIGGEFFSAARQGSTHLLFSSIQRSDHIVIVAIDDATLQAIGRSPLEWTRDEYIPVINALSEHGARVVALDLLMPEPAPGDVALANAIERARTGERRTRFVLAATGGGWVRPTTLPDGSHAARFQARLLPVDVLAQQVDFVGFSNAIIDQTGSQCCQLSLVSVEGDTAISFSLAAYLAYLRIPAEARAEVIRGNAQQLEVTPERSIVVDAFGQWIQNYIAPGARGFTILSFLDVVEGRADLSAIDDRIVLIGLHDAAGAVDTYRVPGLERGGEMSGVEIQANAIETLIRDSDLRTLTRIELLIAIAVISFASALLYEHVRWFLRPVAFIVLMTGLMLAASYAFSVQNVLVPIFDGALVLGLSLGASLIWYTQHQSRQRLLAEYAAGIAEREKQLVEDVILGSPTPTAILNSRLEIMTLNNAFRAMLGADTGLAAPVDLLDALARHDLAEEQRTELHKFLSKTQDFSTQVSFKEQTYVCAGNWLPRINRWVLAWADVTMLTEMNAMKRHMLLMVSHDLRNPLSTLNLQLYQLKRLVGNDQPAIIKSIESAELSAKVMQHILTDVIDLEQVRTLTFPTSPVDMTQICKTVHERYLGDAQRKEQVFRLNIETTDASVQANEGQVVQMVANLVSNALKYTASGGMITVTLRTTAENRVRLEVSDTGIGIPKEAQGKLFTEFYRIKSRATSEIPGTGLGLSLVKTIVRKHGGQIWFESQEGIGTTFYVELPNTRADARAS